MISNFIQWVTGHYYHYLLWCSTCFRFVQWRPFKLASVNSWHIPIILEYVLVFWHKMMFQVPFAFSLPKLNSAISPRNPSSSKWRIIIRSQVWQVWVEDVLIAIGLSLFADCLGGQNLEYMYTHSYIFHIHTYLCL